MHSIFGDKCYSARSQKVSQNQEVDAGPEQKARPGGDATRGEREASSEKSDEDQEEGGDERIHLSEGA